MAQRSFTVEIKGVSFLVTVEYDVDDPTNWEAVSAKPTGDDADFLGFIQQTDLFAEFDRGCDHDMNEWQNTREDPMDVVHRKIEDEMVEGIR